MIPTQWRRSTTAWASTAWLSSTRPRTRYVNTPLLHSRHIIHFLLIFIENAALKDARAAMDKVLGDEIFWDDFSKN